MAIAGTINASMLIMAALFHSAGLTGVADIDKAFEQFRILEGNTPAILFGVALLASGLSSSSVGALSGQVVMQGFASRQIPLFLRRLMTMMPALIILAIGLNPSRSLVISQVVLSFGIPFALVPLLIFCRNRDVMDALVNHRLTTTIATVVVFLIVSLNVFLLIKLLLAKQISRTVDDRVTLIVQRKPSRVASSKVSRWDRSWMRASCALAAMPICSRMLWRSSSNAASFALSSSRVMSAAREGVGQAAKIVGLEVEVSTNQLFPTRAGPKILICTTSDCGARR
jgi:hypothetical protein